MRKKKKTVGWVIAATIAFRLRFRNEMSLNTYRDWVSRHAMAVDKLSYRIISRVFYFSREIFPEKNRGSPEGAGTRAWCLIYYFESTLARDEKHAESQNHRATPPQKLRRQNPKFETSG